MSNLHSANGPQPTIKLPPHFEVVSSLSVPGAEIHPRGLVLIVGPNSSGKTQLLKDIHSVLTGQKRELVVADRIMLSKPGKLDEFVSPLIEGGYLKKERDSNGHEHLRQVTPFLGGGEFKNHNPAISQVQQWFNSWKSDPISERIDTVPFLDLVGHCLTTALFLDKRIALANAVDQFDYENASPTKDLQALHMSTAAKKRLLEETQSVFGKAVWIDSTRGNILCLRVNQNTDLPSADDRLEPEKMKFFRLIESEGDGLRSYVGICIAILLGRRPVCIVDEPELCLHPPQAYAMGKFIGSYGTSENHSTFASTHSSHVLRGIIETTQDVQILRLTRANDRFQGHVIRRETILECLNRPIVRAETILDGIFADGVTLVEADGDRAVYQTAWEIVQTSSRLPSRGENEYIHRDILFIPTGGTGGITDIAKFYRALKIPVTIIADLDLILDLPKIHTIVAAISNDPTADGIVSKCRELSSQIKALPPTLSEEQIRQTLLQLGQRQFSWINDDDRQLRDDLRSLANQIDRMRRLKHGGIEQFAEHEAIYIGLRSLIAECNDMGLFLVPVGELEYWSPELGVSASKQKKAEWANEAAILLRETPDKANDLLDFVGMMGAFHTSEANRLSDVSQSMEEETFPMASDRL